MFSVPFSKQRVSGVSFIELVVALFIIGTLAIGSLSLSSFLNIKKHITQFEIINQTTDAIKQIIQSDCPFKGEVFYQSELSITEILRGGIPLYRSSEHPSFSSRNHDLGEGVFIQSMTLEKPINKSSVFRIKYLYGENAEGVDLTHEKVFSAYIILEPDDSVSHCAPFFCPERYVVPRGNLFSHSSLCETTTDDHIKEWKKTQQSSSKDTTGDLVERWVKAGNPETPFIHFNIPQSFSRKTFRKVKTIEAGSSSCVCLAIFICYQGFWSEALKCFETSS